MQGKYIPFFHFGSATNGVVRSFTYVMVIVMSTFSQSACSASDTFEITRQVLLREGNDPHRIIRVEDGYIIVGSGRQGGVAIKTDLQGKKAWDYFLPREKGVDDPSRSPVFTGVVALKDGNTLLCGGHSKAGEGGKWGPFVGLLIRLDRNGRLLDKRELFPQEGLTTKISRIENCAPNGNGVVVLGRYSSVVSGKDGMQEGRDSHYLLGLDGTGEIQWEKALPAEEVGSSSYGSPVPLLNGEVMVPLIWHPAAGREGKWRTRIIRLNHSGEIVAQCAFQERLDTILPLQPDRIVQLLTQKSTMSQATLIVTLDENFQELFRSQINANVAGIKYRLSDDSYVLFDWHTNFGGAAVPSIQRVSADLVRFRETKLKPEAELSSIRDAIPTGAPGEFAVVRQILHGFDNKTSLKEGAGIGLQIVKIR